MYRSRRCLKLVSQIKQRSKSAFKVYIIHILGIFTFLLQIHTFFGEDIVNARNNYLTGEKTDFWGGMSTLVYAHIPSIGVRWQIWLALFQILITTIGLAKLISIKNSLKRIWIIKVALVYSSLIFSSQMTRDGLMFSLLVLGIALLKVAFQENQSRFKFILPLFLILSGTAFRPWLSISMVPVVILVSKYSKKRVSRLTAAVAILAVSIVPLGAEVAITKSLNLVKSYPEQQVMIMDVAASYCYTNNTSTGIRAKEALELFTSDSTYSKAACQLYRPDTWLSLTKAGNASSEGIKSDFWLIQTGDSITYEKAKSLWLRMILRDPVTFLQNKINFAGKLLIGSDSRNLTFLNEKNTTLKLISLYKLPYDLAITFHLYSLLATAAYLLIGPLIRYRRSKSGNLIVSRETLLLISSLAIWLCLSSIAYIGSNGRYTYTISLLAMVLLISDRAEDKGKSEVANG